MENLVVNRPREAAFAIVLAMAIIGLVDNFVPLIAQEAGLWQFHAMRSAMAVPLLVLIIWIGGRRIRAQSWAKVAFRSAMMGLTMLIYFGCLAVLPIGVVVAGLFTSPLFILVFTAVFLRRPVSPILWSACGLGFIGILLVVRPDGAMSASSSDGAGFDPLMLLPFLAGFFYAITGLSTRLWCQDEDTLVVAMGSFIAMGLMGLVGVIVLLTFGSPEGAENFVMRPVVPPTMAFLFWTAVQAVGGVVGLSFLIRGYQLGEASFAGIFEYSLMIFAAFWAWVIWGQLPGVSALAGMALIALSGLFIALLSREGEAKGPPRAS